MSSVHEQGRLDTGRSSAGGPGHDDTRDTDVESVAELLRVLSHPARLRILALLSGGELCVKRLEDMLGIPQPTVSQHLMRLRYAGLIESERRGHLVCYRLADQRTGKIIDDIVCRLGRMRTR